MAALDLIPIEFVVLPNPQPDEQGRTTYQVRQQTHGALNTRGLVEHMRKNGKMAQYPIDAIIQVLTEEIVEFLFRNNCVHIDGLGTFSLSVGLKPEVDEEGVAHKRQVTDPMEITGNDVEVTGIAFRPDIEFTRLATRRPAFFRNKEMRGVVGHSVPYTREQMTYSLLQYVDQHGSISRRSFIKLWGLTKHQALKWLGELSTGDNPPLLETRPTNAFVYLRNPDYKPEA